MFAIKITMVKLLLNKHFIINTAHDVVYHNSQARKTGTIMAECEDRRSPQNSARRPPLSGDERIMKKFISKSLNGIITKREKPEYDDHLNVSGINGQCSETFDIWTCTRLKGHEGLHEAKGYNHVFARWDDAFKLAYEI